LDAGLRVLALHPNQVAAARPRFRASGGKSDRFDSFVLCELARTDSHRFRVLEPDSDLTKALRALCRGREELVQTRVALANQLRGELERFWSGPIGLFKELDSPISLAFLKRYPSPIEASTLGEKGMAAFLAGQHYSGRKQPSQLLTKLRSAPEGRAGSAELATRRALVLALVAALEPLVTQIKALERQIATAVREHPDGEIFLSLFRDPKSVITAAELLGEIGDCRGRYPTADALAGDAGQAAVAIESGKRKVACYRWACDKRLRDAVCTLADSTRHWHPWAADHYTRARARGHDHQRAIRLSAAPGVGSCGAAGRTASPTTQPATAPCSSTARSPSQPRRGPAPTSSPPSGCSVPPSPKGRPAGPSATRLTASRHPLSRSEVDTGRLT
jgi:transposase